MPTTVDDGGDEISNALAKARETLAAIEAARSNVDELASALRAAGIEDRAASSEEATSTLDESAGQQAALIEILEQALAIINGLKGSGSSGPNPTIPPNRPNPLHAAPPHLREPTAKIGDAVEPGPVTANPYRQELSGTDEGDKTKNRFQRAGRAFARKADDVKDTAKDVTNSTSFTIQNDYDPHSHGVTTSEVSTPANQPSIGSATPHMDSSDVVGTSVIVAAVAIEGMSRLVRKKRSDGK